MRYYVVWDPEFDKKDYERAFIVHSESFNDVAKRSMEIKKPPAHTPMVLLVMPIDPRATYPISYEEKALTFDDVKRLNAITEFLQDESRVERFNLN